MGSSIVATELLIRPSAATGLWRSFSLLLQVLRTPSGTSLPVHLPPRQVLPFAAAFRSVIMLELVLSGYGLVEWFCNLRVEGLQQRDWLACVLAPARILVTRAVLMLGMAY